MLNFPCPHLYTNIKILKIDNSNTKDNGYCLKNNDHYLIYINDKLESNQFETVLIHELLHCKQIQEGYPGLIPAIYGDYQAKYVASMINSVLADIDVEKQLTDMGLHSDYIDYERFKDAKEYANENYEDIQQFFSIMSALYLILCKFTARDVAYYEEIYIVFNNKDKGITDLSNKISEIIEKYGYKTPSEYLRSLRRIAIVTGWRDRFKIKYNGIEQKV